MSFSRPARSIKEFITRYCTDSRSSAVMRGCEPSWGPPVAMEHLLANPPLPAFKKLMDSVPSIRHIIEAGIKEEQALQEQKPVTFPHPVSSIDELWERYKLEPALKRSGVGTVGLETLLNPKPVPVVARLLESLPLPHQCAIEFAARTENALRTKLAHGEIKVESPVAASAAAGAGAGASAPMHRPSPPMSFSHPVSSIEELWERYKLPPELKRSSVGTVGLKALLNPHPVRVVAELIDSLPASYQHAIQFAVRTEESIRSKLGIALYEIVESPAAASIAPTPSPSVVPHSVLRSSAAAGAGAGAGASAAMHRPSPSLAEKKEEKDAQEVYNAILEKIFRVPLSALDKSEQKIHGDLVKELKNLNGSLVTRIEGLFNTLENTVPRRGNLREHLDSYCSNEERFKLTMYMSMQPTIPTFSGPHAGAGAPPAPKVAAGSSEPVAGDPREEERKPVARAPGRPAF